jgi:hypothetical protein
MPLQASVWLCRGCKEERRAQEHITADGGALTGEQRIAAQLEHAAHALAKDLPAVGELLVQLGGDRGVVTGPLTAAELQRAQAQVVKAADEVRVNMQKYQFAACLSSQCAHVNYRPSCSMDADQEHAPVGRCGHHRLGVDSPHCQRQSHRARQERGQ